MECLLEHKPVGTKRWDTAGSPDVQAIEQETKAVYVLRGRTLAVRRHILVRYTPQVEFWASFSQEARHDTAGNPGRTTLTRHRRLPQTRGEVN